MYKQTLQEVIYCNIDNKYRTGLRNTTAERGYVALERVYCGRSGGIDPLRYVTPPTPGATSWHSAPQRFRGFRALVRIGASA